MDEINAINCCLTGKDNLLIQCGEILLSRGHGILGVVSKAQQRANEKNIMILLFLSYQRWNSLAIVLSDDCCLFF